MSSLLKINVSQSPKRVDVDISVSVAFRDLPLDKDIALQKHGIAVIDTGATRTLVCQKILDALQVLPNGKTSIVGIVGQPKEVDTYLIDLHFIGGEKYDVVHTAKNVNVIPLENSASMQVLIGMDVLMHQVKKFTLMGAKAELVF